MCVCVCLCLCVCVCVPIRFHGFQVQSAALDEMFHCSTASVQRYHKGLLLMEGLSRVVTEKRDADSVDKCKCFIFWDWTQSSQMLELLKKKCAVVYGYFSGRLLFWSLQYLIIMSVSLCLFLSRSVSLSLFLSVYVSLSLCLCLSLSVSLSLSLSQVSSASSGVLLPSTARSMLAIFEWWQQGLRSSVTRLAERQASTRLLTNKSTLMSRTQGKRPLTLQLVHQRPAWLVGILKITVLAQLQRRNMLCSLFTCSLGFRNCSRLKCVVCISSTFCTENNYSQQCVLMICFITWRNALDSGWKYCIDLRANKSLIISKTKYCQCVAKLLMQCLVGLCFFLSQVTRCNRKMKV